MSKRNWKRKLLKRGRNATCQLSRYVNCFSIDASTLWRWRKRGYLVPVSIGGKRRYRLSEIKKILGSDMLNQ